MSNADQRDRRFTGVDAIEAIAAQGVAIEVVAGEVPTVAPHTECVRLHVTLHAVEPERHLSSFADRRPQRCDEVVEAQHDERAPIVERGAELAWLTVGCTLHRDGGDCGQEHAPLIGREERRREAVGVGGLVVLEPDAPVLVQVAEVALHHLAHGLPVGRPRHELPVLVALGIGRIAHSVDDVGQRDLGTVGASVCCERSQLQDAFRW